MARKGKMTLLTPRGLVILCVAVLAFAAPAASQSEPLAGFDEYVAGAVEDWGGVGLAVAVVKDGELVFAEGYGVRELGRPGSVDPSTLFAIGSTTKAITAAALGMLVDEGKLGWDDPVIEHLPWFRLADPYLTAEVTVRDLLTHRAGLGRADFLWEGRTDRDAEEIVQALRELEPAYSLRSDFIYQNIMYAAAGLVLEAASGSSWEAFVRTRVFQPLGMTRTVPTLATTRGMENVASPHDVVEGELRAIERLDSDAIAPAGAVRSSVEDMSRWLRFLLRGCETEDGTALLRPATCEELFTPQTVLADPPHPAARLFEPHWNTYGFAWYQTDYEGRKVDYHTGSVDGMVAIAGLIRDEGLGVFVLANRNRIELRHALMYRVFDLYDGDEPRDWSAELKVLYDRRARRADSIAADRSSRRVEGTEPALALEAYAGTYRHGVWGDVEITVWDGVLRLAYGPRQATLRHWHYETFRAEWDVIQQGRIPVTFHLSPSGGPVRLEILAVGLFARLLPLTHPRRPAS